MVVYDDGSDSFNMQYITVAIICADIFILS